MNPYKDKAAAARKRADALNKPTAHSEAMRSAFPLGGGYGNKAGRRRVDASIDRAVKAVKAEREAKEWERMVELFDQGKITAQGRSTNPEQAARAEKAAAYRTTKAERIAAAQAAIEGRDPLTRSPNHPTTMLKYIVSSSTTFTSKKTGLPFTTKGYFQHWIFGEGIGASFGPIENAKRMNFAQARKVAKYSPSYAIEVA